MQEIEFAVPIPSRVNPDLTRARTRHLQWVRDSGLVSNGEARRRYEFSHVADIAAHGFPDATGERLDLCFDLLGWMFLFDDQFDADDGREADALAVCEQLTDVLTGGPSAHGSPPPIVTAFADCWQRMSTDMSQAWLRRTVHDWADYLAGWPTKIVERAHRAILTPAAHLRARRRTIGCRPVLALAERVGRFEVPPPVWHASHLEGMRLAACDAVIAMNEIHSYEKDRVGGYANLVSSLVHHDGLSEAEAGRQVRETVRLSVESFLHLRSGLPDFGRAVGADATVLAQYGRALAACIRGYHDWGQSAPRYTTREHPGDLGLENLLTRLPR
ncbi:terpene synthase family protein [Streptomyces uncialis]|uniref:terpene synthase family protein n=1 Tax=Streptomyces uncialis TaxID=1048205 RepID=UPI0037B72326